MATTTDSFAAIKKRKSGRSKSPLDFAEGDDANEDATPAWYRTLKKNLK